jgi:hypothetical protein
MVKTSDVDAKIEHLKELYLEGPAKESQDRVNTLYDWYQTTKNASAASQTPTQAAQIAEFRSW